MSRQSQEQPAQKKQRRHRVSDHYVPTRMMPAVIMMALSVVVRRTIIVMLLSVVVRSMLVLVMPDLCIQCYLVANRVPVVSRLVIIIGMVVATQLGPLMPLVIPMLVPLVVPVPGLLMHLVIPVLIPVLPLGVFMARSLAPGGSNRHQHDQTQSPYHE